MIRGARHAGRLWSRRWSTPHGRWCRSTPCDPDAEALRQERALLPKAFAIVVGAQFVEHAGIGLIAPLLPALAEQMCIGATGAGLLLSMPSLSKLMLNMQMGRRCDAFGRTQLMVGGSLVEACGSLGTGLSPSMPFIMASRFLVGAGCSATEAGSSAYMADLTDRVREHRAKILGVQSGIISAAYVAGPALGGGLVSLYSPQTAFVLIGAATAVCSVAYAQLPELRRLGDEGGDGAAPTTATGATAQTAATTATPWHVWRGLMRVPAQQAALAATCALYTNYACELSVLTLHAARAFAATPGDLGLLFAGVWGIGTMFAPAGGWLADRFGHRRALAPAIALSATGLAGAAMAGTYAQFIAALICMSVASGLSHPALSAYAVEVSPAATRAQALALHRQFSDVVWVLAPVGLGLLADCTSLPTAMVCSSAVIAASGLCFFGLSKGGGAAHAGGGGWRREGQQRGRPATPVDLGAHNRQRRIAGRGDRD